MKGYITVYLALVTGILLSMFLTVIGASRRDLIRLQIECCTDMAMQSALAQYHQEMLSRYGLFFVDTSYGSGEPDYHKTEQMICSYLEKNLAPEQTFAVSGAGNLTGLSAESVELLQAGAATDENFGVLKYHVVQYMKDCYGISAAQGLLALGEQLAGSGYTGDGIEQEWDAAQAQLTEEIRSGKRLQDEEWDGNIPETPSDAVQATRGEGILSRVVKEKKLSSKAVSAQSLVSGRKRNQGTGLSAKKLVPDSVWENGLLYAYILEKCGYFGAEKENSALDYQVEYILHGQEGQRSCRAAFKESRQNTEHFRFCGENVEECLKKGSLFYSCACIEYVVRNYRQRNYAKGQKKKGKDAITRVLLNGLFLSGRCVVGRNILLLFAHNKTPEILFEFFSFSPSLYGRNTRFGN